MAIVPYLDEEALSPKDRELLERPINLFRALAHSPKALRAHAAFGDWVRHDCDLNPRLREMAILQVGYSLWSPYEWSHHLSIGEEAGVSAADVEGLVAETEGRRSGLDDLDVAVLEAARKIATGNELGERLERYLLAELGPGKFVDLIEVTAFYVAVVRVLLALRVDVEDEYQPYLDRHRVPAGATPDRDGQPPS